MIHVLALIEVAEGRREEFLREFRRIVPTVRAEQGCIEYGPAIDLPTDIPTQQPPRDNVVTVIEKWKSVDALKAHAAAPHMQEYRQRVKGLALGTKLYILQPAAE